MDQMETSVLNLMVRLTTPPVPDPTVRVITRIWPNHESPILRTVQFPGKGRGRAFPLVKDLMIRVDMAIRRKCRDFIFVINFVRDGD